MADRTVRFILTGDSAGAVKAMDESAVAADASATKMGDSMDGASSRIGGIFQKLGNTLGSFGIPFSGAIGEMGSKLDETSTKGQKFGAAMSTLGGATLAGAAVGFVAVWIAPPATTKDCKACLERIRNAILGR